MDIRVTVKLPDEILNLDSGRVSRDVLEQVVIEGYKNGGLGPKQVRLLLGFSSRLETEEFLRRHRAMDYSVDDMNDDMETIRKLGLL